MLGVFAEFETNLRRAATGRRRQGKGRRRLQGPAIVDRSVKAHGMRPVDIAKAHKIGRASVYRRSKFHSKSEPEMTAARSGGRRPSSNLDVEVLYKEVRRCRSDPYAGKPTSQTLVKRHRVSISCMCFSSEAAGAVAAFLHAASVKWIWLFQNPATMVLPVQSMTRASLVIARRCGGPRGDHAARHDNDAIPERSGIR
jgi:hypothetical protein